MIEQKPVCDPKWYFSIGGGIDIDFGDTEFEQGLETDIALFTFIDIQSRDWDDVYDNSWRIQGEVGYALSQHLEIFGLFRYAHADADDPSGGSSVFIDVPGLFFAEIPLTSDFGDYESYGGELGLRYYFLPKQSRIRPYVSLSGGATYVDNIHLRTVADFTQIGGPSEVDIFNGGFLDESWVAAGSASLGVEVAVTCNFVVGVNGGVRYESSLEDDDSDFNSTDFDTGIFGTVPLSFANGINDDAGERWTCPVTGYFKFRF